MIIKIPFKTPTVNHIYFNWNNRRILTKEARELKKEILEIVQKVKQPFNKKTFLEVNVKIYEDWFTKKGEIKRKDISNREKFLIDSIFEALGLDDKQIFIHTMKKKQSSKEYAEIIIEEYKGDIF